MSLENSMYDQEDQLPKTKKIKESESKINKTKEIIQSTDKRKNEIVNLYNELLSNDYKQVTSSDIKKSTGLEYDNSYAYTLKKGELEKGAQKSFKQPVTGKLHFLLDKGNDKLSVYIDKDNPSILHIRVLGNLSGKLKQKNFNILDPKEIESAKQYLSGKKTIAQVNYKKNEEHEALASADEFLEEELSKIA